jgi:hypothetical protein
MWREWRRYELIVACDVDTSHVLVHEIIPFRAFDFDARVVGVLICFWICVVVDYDNVRRCYFTFIGRSQELASIKAAVATATEDYEFRNLAISQSRSLAI